MKKTIGLQNQKKKGWMKLMIQMRDAVTREVLGVEIGARSLVEVKSH